MYEPEMNQNNIKVIFLLHGYGSNEKDLFSLKDFIPPNYIIISLRAPISLGFNSYAWYSINFEKSLDKWINNDEAIHSKNIIKNDVLSHLKDLNIDNHSTYLLGFSQGAILSWTIGIENSNLIKNILPLSGFYHSQITDTDFNPKYKLNCFSSHGVNDPIIPVNWARNGVKDLKKNNINIFFKEYDSGHEISNENLKDVICWLNNN